MLDILPETPGLLILDVRQSGSGPDSLAMVCARLGRWRAVVWHSGAAIRLSEQCGDVVTLVSSLHYRALALRALGSAQAAIADAEAAVRVARQAHRPRLELDALRVLVGVLWLAGDRRAEQARVRADTYAGTLRPDG